MDDIETAPTPVPLAGSEVDTLLGSLDRNRQTFAWKCGGLDAAGTRATLGPSAVTLGGLLKHLALVEDTWFTVTVGGGSLAPPFDAIDFDADPEWEWRTAANDSPDELMEMWRAAVERSRRTVAATLVSGGLDTMAVASDWPSPPSLRRCLVDMVEEYARHTGHADLIRESIDGLVGEGMSG